MKKNFTNKLWVSALLFLTGCGMTFGQTAYTFTVAGATGNNGPTQAQINTAYSSTNLAGNVTATGGIQFWTVPTSGLYKIECYGAQGFGSFGGRGAKISGEFNLVAGSQLKILVGQKAPPPVGSANQYAGGGGSFVTTLTNVPLVVAGGGGGNHGSAFLTNADASITNNGFAGTATNSGSAGTGGSGGGTASSADGGGGFNTNGGGIGGGFSFINGAVGGAGTTSGHGQGGFGCGGGTSSWDNYRAGGGGGYSGGGGGGENGTLGAPAGGGGGSFNSGTNPIVLAGAQIGNGLIVITSLQTFPNDAGISQFIGFAPPNCKGTKTVQAQITNFGNNVISQVTVGWSVNGVNQTPLAVNQTIDTNNSIAGNTFTVTLGNTFVSGPTTIKAWTIAPNSATDPSPGNDSSSVTLNPFDVNATSPFPTLICPTDMNGLAIPSTTNATGPVTYVWSNGSTSTNLLGVGAGTYFVVATNGTCVDTSNLVVITAPPVIASAALVTNTTCFGSSNGSCVLTVSGGTPGYTVNWPGQGTGFIISNLVAGNYNYVITDANGCNVTNSISVTQPPQLVVTSVVSNVSTVPNNGGIDISVTGGTPNYTYLWNNSATTEDLSNLAAGTYTITVTDLFGCTAVLQSTVLNVVGLDEKTIDLGLTVYPNPTSGIFTIEIANSNEKVDLQIFDLLGKKVLELNQVKSKTNITLNEREGIYLVKIKSGDQTKVQKIVLKK